MMSRIKQPTTTTSMGSVFVVRMVLSILLVSLLPTDVYGNRNLRKRVKPDSTSSIGIIEQNEFGRDFQLFPSPQNKQLQRNELSSTNKKNKRRNKQRDIVAVEKEELLIELENELKAAEITERILNYMSLSMSIPQTPSPTPAYIAPRTPPPTEVPSKGPTPPPMVYTIPPTQPPMVYTIPPTVQTSSPTPPPKVYTNPPTVTTSSPTVYIYPTPPPYANAATYTPTERIVPTDPPTVKPTIYYVPVGNPTNVPVSEPPAQPSTSVPVSEPPAQPSTSLPVSEPPAQPSTTVPEPTTSQPSATVPVSNPTVQPSAVVPEKIERVLSVQETEGVCNGPSNGVGCASESEEMQGGNPNDIANCFDVTTVGLAVPFELTAVRFWVGDSADLPADLSIRVWEGTVATGPTMNVLYTQELSGFTSGQNNVFLTSELLIFQTEFCVGVTSVSMDDGLRVQTDGGDMQSNSFIMSPRCGITEFRSLTDIMVMGDFCIEAFVSSSTAQ
jgi:hypothetical protein